MKLLLPQYVELEKCRYFHILVPIIAPIFTIVESAPGLGPVEMVDILLSAVEGPAAGGPATTGILGEDYHSRIIAAIEC